MLKVLNELNEFEGNDINVIQNSDVLFKNEVEWTKDIEYREPNEYEKEMTKDTMTPEQLLQQEQEEKENYKEPTEEEKEQQRRHDYITKVKVIAMDKMGKSIISNPSYWRHEQKNTLKNIMQNIIDTYTEEELQKQFNEVVNEKLFDVNRN